MRGMWLAALGCGGPVGRPPPSDATAPETGSTGSTADTGGPHGPFHTASARLHDNGSLVYARWSQDAPAVLRVEFSFEPGVWRSAPPREYPAGSNEQLLVGIPFETEATWRLVGDEGELLRGEPVTTAPWPAGLPRPVLVIAEPARQLPAEYLLTSINTNDGGWTTGTYWSILLDRQGRLIWAQQTPGQAWTLFTQLAASGDHLLWDEQTKWRDWDDGLGSKVHATWLDREIEVIDTPGLHHPFVQLPDGTLAWGSLVHGGGEALVEKAPGQQDETVVWNCRWDWPQGGFQCESNGLFFVPATQSYLYSFYTNSSVVEIDRATGSTLWWAGAAAGGYTFSPPDATFSWQHGVSYTEAGTLLLSSEYGHPEETWLLEYEVDRAQGELRRVWSDSAGVRAFTNGQAWRLSNGNTLHVVGSAGVVREVAPDGEDVWRLDFQGEYLLGHGQLLQDLYGLVAPATEE